MTVNKVGRPSKTAERREQILIATRAVVARHGVAGATLARIAEQAGLQRTLVMHYFRDRDSLMHAFIAESVAAYGDAMLRDSGRSSLAARVDDFFGAKAYESDDDLAVWLELVALATRDAGVRDQLHELWTRRWLPALERRLAADYPAASRATVAQTAYALTCLFEAHWSLHAQDVAGRTRQRQARAAARTLLAALGDVVT